MPESLLSKTKQSIDFEQAKSLARKKREELFAEIGAVTDRQTAIASVKRVFEHSVEDGLALITRLQLSGAELAEVIMAPAFIIKHPGIFDKFRLEVSSREATKAIDKNPESGSVKKKILKKISDLDGAKKSGDWDGFMEEINQEKDLQAGVEAIKIIDDYYAPLLKVRKFAPRKISSAYPTGETVKGLKGETRQLKSVEELADEALETYQLMLLPAYYAGTVEEILRRQLKVNKLNSEPRLKRSIQNYFSTTEDIQAECSRLNLFFAEIEPKLKSAEYGSITAGLKKSEAESGICKKLNQSLADRGQKVELKGNKYEVVDDVGETEDEQDEQSDFAKFEQKSLDYIEQLLQAGADKGQVAAGLAGLDSDRAWKLREQLIQDGADKDFIALGLAGLDSERAWQMRERLLQAGANKSWVARGLAGLDSDRAWQMRERLLQDGADKDFIALGLAGLDSERAWEMRRHFIQAGANKSWVALGLAGDYITFVWQLKEKKQVLEKRKKVLEKKEQSDFAKFEQKSLDYIEQLIQEGVNKGSVAVGLAGLDSDRAWKLREQLLQEGADKDWVAQGLAGLDSDRAWKLREQLIQDGADKDYIALGLAGLDSERAWQMREQLLQEGASKSWVAQGLAGLDSERAWQMREQLLQEGASKSWVAQGLAGLDSERAWQMRERLLQAGANNDWVALGLAGLDSERAWQMRERLLQAGANKGFVAQGLAGLDSKRAWQMRERLLQEGVKGSVALGLAGLDSERAWEMREQLLQEGANKSWVALGLAGDYITFVWQLKEKKQVLEKTEEQQLKLLNLLHQPTLDGIHEYFGGNKTEIESQLIANKKSRNYLGGSTVVTRILNKLIAKNSEQFLETMPAKLSRGLDHVFAEQLTAKIFPEIKIAQAQRAWRGFSGYSGLEAGRSSQREPQPFDYLNPRSQESLSGGGAEAMNDNREIMEFRDQLAGIIVTGIYGRYNPSSKDWEKSNFSLNAPLVEPIKETTATIADVKSLTEISLPKPLEAKIIPERVKGFDGLGQEYDLKIEVNSLAEVKVVDKPKAVEKIVYSLAVALAPEPLEDLTQRDYDSYKQKLEIVSGRDLTSGLASLPEDLELELLELIKGKSPKEQVVAIERWVRDLGYYDYNNQEVNQLKAGKSLEEKLYIMEQRLEELRQNNPDSTEFVGKRFAGVCADFAQITATLLRRAGFASGIISGFSSIDKKIRVKHAHATAFILWPDHLGYNRAISIDGTPDGLMGISLPSLVEREAEIAGKEKELSNIATSEIQQIIENLNSLDVETVHKMSNGELERTLNSILKYQVKESQLDIIERLFDYYWYTPIHQLDLVNPYQRGEAMIELAGAVERQRKRLLSQPEKDETPAGNKLMQMMQGFLGRFAVAGVSEDKYAAIDLMEKIVELVQNDLTEAEQKAAFATIAYLKAKNILGDKK